MAIIAGQINPANYPQPDYSGVVRSAQMQAQGLADIGKSISGVIDNFGAAKVEQKKVDAYNKASAKSIEAAITLGESYKIKGVKETLNPFLELYNDPNLSPIEKAALLDEGKAMIPNVFGRFDQSQANAIQQAQVSARNAPPLPEQRTYKREPYKYGSGELQGTQRGSDGQLYDENFNLIRDINAYAEGQPVEVYSYGAGQSAASAINAGLNLPFYGGVGESPPMIYGPDGAPMLLPPPEGTTPISPSAIDSSIALDPRQARQVPGEPPASIALPRPAPQLKSRVVPTDKVGEAETFRPFTPEEIARYRSDGQVSSTGKVYPIRPPSGTEFTTNPDGSVTYRQGVGVGTKAQTVEKAREDMSDQSFRLNQNNTEEAFTRLDEIGTNSPIFAAGNTLLANALPATDQGELQGFFERVNGENSFIKMSQLRASSPTGGAAGTMTEKEWPRFEGRFAPLRVNAKKDTLAKSLSLNLLNAFEAANGTPNDVIKLLNEKKIDQPTFDNYVQEYLTNRKIARIDDKGIEGASYDWTKINKELLNKSTNNKQVGIPTSGPNSVIGLDEKTKNALKILGIDE